ncbi:MAG: hypothetical protein WCJ30_13825 [Deltaproteobacteria bacterium]
MHPVHRLALPALAFALAACASAQTPAPSRPLEARDYFPLHREAAWSFDSEDVGAPGTTGLVVMRVVRDDGAGGFYVQQGNHGAPALYDFREGSLTRNGETILSNPIAAGTRWEGSSHDGYVIRNVGLTRTVPAGTFHDVIEVVRTAAEATLVNGTEYRETFFYAPRVGPIEAMVPVMMPSNEVRRFHLVLRGYTLDGQF